MEEASVIVGILIVLYIVIFGLAIYFMIVPLRRMRRKQQLLEIRLIVKEKELVRASKKVAEKRIALEELSKKIKRAGRKSGRIVEVKRLRSEVAERRKKNYELEMELKRLKHNVEREKRIQLATKSRKPKSDDSETRKIKQRYPTLPKDQHERIEIERSIARSLMKNNGGSFHMSQILKTIERLYSKHIKPNDRIMLLSEIKNWIERDPLCRIVKTMDKIQHYTFI